MIAIAKKYFQGLQRVFLNTPAAQDTAIIYVSSLFSSAVGFVASLLVARHLGPADFGIVTAYNSIVLTLTGLTDFGLGVGLIKFVTPLLQSSLEKARSYLRFVLYAELASGLTVLVLGTVLAGTLHNFVGSSISVGIIRLAIISAAVTSTAAFNGAVLNAYKRFKLNAALNTGASLLRFLYILFLLKILGLSISNIIIGSVGIAVLAAVVGFIVIPKDFFGEVKRGELKIAGKAVLGFSGWLTISYVLTAVSGRLDFFYLYRLRGATQAGIYGAAIQLSLAFSLLVGAISTVMTPYISEKITLEQKRLFLKKTLALSAFGALLFLASMFIMPTVISLLFGAKYLGAIVPLKILIVHFALNVFLIPITLMYIPFGQVKVGTLVSALQLVVALILYPILIRHFGAAGAAGTVLSGTIIGLLVYPTVLRWLMHNEAKKMEAV